jgi:hypothetical protein
MNVRTSGTSSCRISPHASRKCTTVNLPVSTHSNFEVISAKTVLQLQTLQTAFMSTFYSGIFAGASVYTFIFERLLVMARAIISNTLIYTIHICPFYCTHIRVIYDRKDVSERSLVM